MSDSWEMITEKANGLKKKLLISVLRSKSRQLKDFISGYILKIKIFKNNV